MKRIISVALITLVFFGCKDERSELGDKHFKKGEYKEAIDAYTEYLRLEPTDVKSLYNRGRAYEEVGEHEKALADFNKVIKEDPLNVNALLSLANDYYYRVQDYENTVFYAEKVLKLSENNVNAHTLRGKGFQKLGKLSEAMSAYNAAISVNDQYAEAYISRGSLRIYLKQNSKACNDFKVAEGLGAEQGAALVKKYCK